MAKGNRVGNLIGAVLLICSVATFAQTPIQNGKLVDADKSTESLLTCWYNEKKDYTGSDSAQPGVKRGIEKTGKTGDYAYGYTFAGAPGSCPKKLPTSPHSTSH